MEGGVKGGVPPLGISLLDWWTLAGIGAGVGLPVPLMLIDSSPPPSSVGPRSSTRGSDMIGSLKRPPRTAAVAVRLIGEGPPIGEVLRRVRE